MFSYWKVKSNVEPPHEQVFQMQILSDRNLTLGRNKECKALLLTITWRIKVKAPNKTQRSDETCTYKRDKICNKKAMRWEYTNKAGRNIKVSIKLYIRKQMHCQFALWNICLYCVCYFFKALSHNEILQGEVQHATSRTKGSE